MGLLRRSPVILVFGLILVATSYSAGQAAPPDTSPRLSIVEKDFHISLGRKVVSSGAIRLQVKNKGPDSHELLVVRKHGPLTLRPDALTVDEEALESGRAIAGILEAGETGALRTLRLDLRPGRYELFCNMSGHYLGGMHTDLIVR